MKTIVSITSLSDKNGWRYRQSKFERVLNLLTGYTFIPVVSRTDLPSVSSPSKLDLLRYSFANLMNRE